MAMRMEEGLDTGPVCLAERVAIGADETAGELHDRLALLGAELMARDAPRCSKPATLACTPQAEAGVTYAKKIEKAGDAHRLGAAGRRSPQPHPRALPLPRRLVRDACREAGRAGEGAPLAPRAGLRRARHGPQPRAARRRLRRRRGRADRAAARRQEAGRRRGLPARRAPSRSARSSANRPTAASVDACRLLRNHY